VYDALSTARPYRPALSRQAALAEIERCRGWWSEAVYAAFVKSLDGLKSAPDAKLTAAPETTSSVG
jgi:HD-GYP domain-containing protein (c-di-GMP phosphodiesterase class II)